MPTYDEFEIRFVGGPSGLRLLARTPEGEAAADTVLPAVGAEDPTAPVCESEPSASEPWRELGQSLFEALFPPQILTLLDRSTGGRVESGAERRLRIRLRFDVGDAAAAEASRLPWELALRDGAYLALDPRYAIVRAVDAPHPVSASRFEPPLRVLVARASPAGTPTLALDREQDWVHRTWSRPDVALTTVDDVSRRSLREAVEGGGVHLLHFMGHGRLDGATGRGSLVFDTGKGGVDEVHGDQVATLLRSPALRLVVLNACKTAGAVGTRTSAMSHVAAAMTWAGVTAAVAMQQPILDSAAILFGGVLHEALAAEEPLEEAVRRARVALHVEQPDSWDWFAPVLFLRAPDGDLFRREEGEGPEASRASARAEIDRIVDAAVEVVGERGDGTGVGARGPSEAELRAGTVSGGSLIITARDHRR